MGFPGGSDAEIASLRSSSCRIFFIPLHSAWNLDDDLHRPRSKNNQMKRVRGKPTKKGILLSSIVVAVPRHTHTRFAVFCQEIARNLHQLHFGVRCGLRQRGSDWQNRSAFSLPNCGALGLASRIPHFRCAMMPLSLVSLLSLALCNSRRHHPRWTSSIWRMNLILLLVVNYFISIIFESYFRIDVARHLSTSCWVNEP